MFLACFPFLFGSSCPEERSLNGAEVGPDRGLYIPACPSLVTLRHLAAKVVVRYSLPLSLSQFYFPTTAPFQLHFCTTLREWAGSRVV